MTHSVTILCYSYLQSTGMILLQRSKVDFNLSPFEDHRDVHDELRVKV
jgi:hypothetical protein